MGVTLQNRDFKEIDFLVTLNYTDFFLCQDNYSKLSENYKFILLSSFFHTIIKV